MSGDVLNVLNNGRVPMTELWCELEFGRSGVFWKILGGGGRPVSAHNAKIGMC